MDFKQLRICLGLADPANSAQGLTIWYLKGLQEPQNVIAGSVGNFCNSCCQSAGIWNQKEITLI